VLGKGGTCPTKEDKSKRGGGRHRRTAYRSGRDQGNGRFDGRKKKTRQGQGKERVCPCLGGGARTKPFYSKRSARVGGLWEWGGPWERGVGKRGRSGERPPSATSPLPKTPIAAHFPANRCPFGGNDLVAQVAEILRSRGGRKGCGAEGKREQNMVEGGGRRPRASETRILAGGKGG